LYADGRIRFHYGAGNDPVSPTIGISNGDGTNYLLSQYDGDTSLTSVGSLQISPPDPLPEGMELSAAGVLSGTPLEFGEFNPKIRVIDALDRIDTKQLTLIIHEDPISPVGDLNCDCGVDFADINAFVLALSSPDAYAAAYPECDRMLADVNDDGVVDFKDINPFVLLLTR
jgi:hypothetical protein